MNTFDIKLESVLGWLFGRSKPTGVIVAKALDFTAPTITHVPGYMWSLDGFAEIWGDPKWDPTEDIGLPYSGRCLYGARIDPSKFIRWPFKWTWGDAKGHTGPPRVIYSPDEINEFVLQAMELDDLVPLAEKMGKPSGDPREVARDVVKSIKPGIIIPAHDTYSNNFEVIINEPVKMTRLAVGHMDEIGNNNFNNGQILTNMRKL